MSGNELCRAAGFYPVRQGEMNVNISIFPLFQSFGDCLPGLRFDFVPERRGQLLRPLPKGFLVLFHPFGNLPVKIIKTIMFGAPSPCRCEQQSGNKQQTGYDYKTNG